jgi:nucleoside-diphosphate-sugar epimerase
MSIDSASTVLVTGGTGFVGAYVIRDLVHNGFRVKALRRKNNLPNYIDDAVWQKVEWITCDIFDVAGLQEAVQEVDAVIHSAAIVSFHASDRNTLFRTNIEGTENVVNACINAGVKRLVHVSSVAALGKRNQAKLTNESAKWQPSRYTTAYAISKHHAEMHVWRGIAEGLNAVIVNPSTILGYGDWHSSSNAIFRNVHSGFRWYPGGSTGFVDVEDVSDIIVRLLTTNIHSERFILSAENWTYKKLFETIAQGFKAKGPSMRASPVMASLAWRMEKVRSIVTGRRPLLSRETARISQSQNSFDNSKILDALPGFTFTNLEDTIRRACEKYLQQNS